MLCLRRHLMSHLSWPLLSYLGEEHRPPSPRLESTSAASSDGIHTLRATCQNLGHSSTQDQWTVAGMTFLELFRTASYESRTDFLVYLGNNFGVDKTALSNAITVYSRNDQLSNEVKRAATPFYQTLFQSVGNRKGGVKTICDLRAHALGIMADGRTDSCLRRVEEVSRELLTTWFCLSNLKLERLTWESPADILYKVAKYEAVHPIAGLTDLMRRVGPSRRCFLFTHEAMPREPLVVIHIALSDSIADNIQRIVRTDGTPLADEEATTANYYSISSTQKGLQGIDLGNLLIKGVVKELQKELPKMQTHSTLSPIPGFRAWLLRSLKGNSEYGEVVDEWIMSAVSALLGREVDEDGCRLALLESLTQPRLQLKHIEFLKEVLMRLCAVHILKAKNKGFAANTVANFHIRNGAEVYRLNWGADQSARGMEGSFGIMVNYRYNLDDLHVNSDNYTIRKQIAAHPQILNLLE